MRFTWPLTDRAEEVRAVADAMSDPALPGIVLCSAGTRSVAN